MIDDDPGFIVLATELFHLRGWDVVACPRAGDAMDCVRRERPDAVILDIRMTAAISGWDLLTQLGEDVQTSEIPVIVCSAASDELRRNGQWLRDRGIGVLSKPFNIEDLFRQVEAAIGHDVDRRSSA